MATSLSYLPIEVRSYLPGGWVLSDSAVGEWNAKDGVWEITVSDGADADHKVRVEASVASSAGRMQALRDAVDKTYRRSLGKKGIFG